MDAFKEFQGKDINAAVVEACNYFGVSREQLEIEILRDAKSGIFGIVGTCKASVRARLKQAEESVKTEHEELSAHASPQPAVREKRAPQNRRKRQTPAKREESKPEPESAAAPQASPEDKKFAQAEATLAAFSTCEKNIPAEEMPDELPEGLPLLSAEQLASESFRAFLEEVLQKIISTIIGEEVGLQFEVFQNRVRVHIDSGEYSGLLIGREGQTLVAIQYLTSRIVTHKFGAAVRLQLDAGEYRQRQEEKLQEIAHSLAERARQTGRSFSTRPLSSYHRRVVHLSLQDEHDIQTRSIGVGTMKRVVIMYKRNEKGESEADEE
ncbi:MAG: Jag N-terminal domain-containing protein [Desulfovibrio sp.]|nr:Jag N-terminal domain-containing protein [Desulfovibrio sp.]